MTSPTRSTTSLDSRLYSTHLTTLKKDIQRAPGKKDLRFSTACQEVVSHLAHTTNFNGRTTNQITALFTTFLKQVEVQYQTSKNASTLKNSHFLFSVSRNLAWNNQARIFSVFGTIFELARQTHPEKWDRYDCDLLPLDPEETDFENSSLFIITLIKHPPAPTVQRPVLAPSSADVLTRDGSTSVATSLHPQPVLEQPALLPSPLPSTGAATSDDQAALDLTQYLNEVDNGPDTTPYNNNANVGEGDEDYDFVGEDSGDSDFEDVLQQQPKVDTTQLNARLLQLALKGDDDTGSEEET